MNPFALPPAALDSAEHAFDAALARVVQQVHRDGGGAPDALAPLADATCAASQAIRDGHVCALLDDDLTLAALRQSPAVGDGAAPLDTLIRPLVLDGRRLYLLRYWQHERRLAARLAALNAPLPAVDTRRLRALLDALFPAGDQAAADWQKLAAASAAQRRLCVLSGGPGTGKTSTVVRLLAALIALQPDLRIALAAPTGKAAARMSESIRAQIAGLPVDRAVRDALPHAAQTVHRLLGSQPGRVAFRHDAEHPLPLDVLVVDEASMLDLALASRLVQALPAQARLILLGDKDQLASVEAGAVFAELSRARGFSATGRAALAAAGGIAPESLPAADAEPGPLADAVIWLTHSYRFAADSALGRIARAVNAGDVDGARAAFDGDALVWAPVLPSPTALAERLIEGYAAFLSALADGREPQAVLAAFDRFRVLCATRGGAYGSGALNEALGDALRRRIAPDTAHGARWYAGRPVIVTRNDYALKLFNGDIGVALPDAAGQLRVWFPADGGGVRAVAPGRLSEADSAFALTIHKSQGSEFSRVDIVVAADAARALSRELLYTGLTRARDGLRLWCPPEVLAEAIARPTERRSALFAAGH